VADADSSRSGTDTTEARTIDSAEPSAGTVPDRGSGSPADAELDYDSLPDPLEGRASPEPELDYDSLPDPLEGRASPEPELDYDLLPDPLEGRGDEEPTPPESPSESAVGRADVSQAAPDGASEDLAPAAEVEARAPGTLGELNGPDTVSDRAEAARTREVIAGAKAELTSRQAAGDKLGGDPIGRADQWHLQGADPQMQGTCGLASCADVLRDCGREVSENDIVHEAADSDRCVTDADPQYNGGANMDDISSLMSDHGVANEVLEPRTPAELAGYVEDGRGVITSVFADRLWGEADGPSVEAAEQYSENEQGQVSADHAVVVTGTVRNEAGTLTGFVINDHGDEEGAGRVVGLDDWNSCWTDVTGGHLTAVTVNPTSAERKTAP
jgi:hypothetical protein